MTQKQLEQTITRLAALSLDQLEARICNLRVRKLYRAQALLALTARIYTVTERAVERTSMMQILCVYRTREGKSCAIGRWIPEKLYSPALENKGASSEAVLTVLQQTDLRGIPGAMLKVVQELHDYGQNWRFSGLSETGRMEYADGLKRLAELDALKPLK